MKRIISLSFFTFFVGGNIFAQSKPVEAFRNFWSMALSNNFESSRNFVISTRQTQELKYKQIQNSFQIIFQNELQFPELDNSQIFPDSAYFNFQIESKEKKKFKGQALLLRQNDEWKIILFDVTPMNEVRSLPFTPSPGFPLPKTCSICG